HALLVIYQKRYGTLVGFFGVWALSLIAMLIAAMQPKAWVRIGWAVVLAFATTAGFAFIHTSGNELGVFDVLSLWNARHEAARAFEFYSGDLIWAVLLF